MKTKPALSTFTCAFLLVMAIFALTAQAAPYTVTNTDNDGEGSLRAAINAANSTPDDDTISFMIPGCESGGCTIGFSGEPGSTVLNIHAAGRLTIANSPNANNIVISANGTDRVFIVRGGANLTLSGITVTGGNSNSSFEAPFDAGAGIYNTGGTVTLVNSVVTGNTGSGTENVTGAGGITNQGNLTLTDSTVSNNNGFSAGLYNTGTALLTNSSVRNNNGVGLIGANGGSLTVNNSSIRENIIAIIINNESAAMTFTNSSISGHTEMERSNIENSGTLTLISSTVNNNAQSIVNHALLRVIDSNIRHNGIPQDSFGGAIFQENPDANAVIINSTINNNTGLFAGGISLFSGTVTLINSTIARNSGDGLVAGGIFINGGSVLLRNTIVAENTLRGTSSNDINNNASLISKGNNLIGNSQNSNTSWQSSDILNQSPRFAPFGNYGGFTQTFALTNNSPARNAGNNCVVTANGCTDNNPAIPTDQRGASRVGAVDIGAFELNNTATGGTYRAVTKSGKVNTVFSYQLTPDSGSFTYSITAGSLPPGLVLSNTPGSASAQSRSAAKNALVVPQAGPYSITGTPTMGGTFDYTITASNGTDSVSTDYTTTIQAAPTAASVSVGGRVLFGSELLRGISNAQVTLTDQNGQTRTVRTNSFGYFYFESVPVGETYIISATHKCHQFAPQVVSLNEELNNLIFTPTNE